MNIAEKIIAKFGSQSELARLVGKRPSTVQAWAQKGIIPAKWQSELLRLAQERGLDLSPSDFMETLTSASLMPEIISPIPKATHWGELTIGDNITLPCYVLENGERVFSIKGIMVGLIGIEGGPLADYLMVSSLKSYLPFDLTPDENGNIPALVSFDTSVQGFAKNGLGIPVERLMDLCAAYSSAYDDEKLTERQKKIAVTANRILRSCAKVGIIALVDEVTGYQYEREHDALQFKLKVFLEEEMRPWEKTFPDELWLEFGRLTNWSGPVTSRPKWWGKLVNELVYEYLDADVAKWLKENAPKPRHGQNYFQWLSSQYGLKKLIEHIWKLIGIASACHDMQELRERMAIQYGRQRVQLSLFLPPPTRRIS
jgi:hypothetical protein